MADHFVETHIRQLPLFTNVPDHLMPWIIEAFRVMRIEPGEYVFREGEQTEGMYLLVEGRAQLVKTGEDGKMESIGVLLPNQYINEAALFTPGTEAASLYVLETATILFLSRQKLMNVASHHPEIKPYLPMPEEAMRGEHAGNVFKGQRDNEIVLIDTHRHWWAFVRQAWLPALVAIFILFLSGQVPFSGLIVFIDLLAIIIPALIMLYLYIEWRNDRFIITDQRVIHIERNILTFESSLSETPLSSIQEVNAEFITVNPLSRVLNFGKVELKTPGGSGNMELTIIPDPEAIQDIIFANRARRSAEAQREHRNTIRATVDQAIGSRENPQGVQQKEAVDSEEELAKANKGKRRANRSLLPTRYIDSEGRIVYRKHLFFWLRGTLVPGFGLILSVVLVLIALTAPGLGFLRVIGPIFGFFMALLFLGWVYYEDWDWRHDIYIIGDEMIEIIHRRPLWMQDDNDQIILERIDNVISEQSGVLQSTFNYGDVRISLLGSDQEGQKVFRGVPDPKQVQSEVTRQQSLLRENRAEAEERRRRNEIAEYLSVYHETISSTNDEYEEEPPPTQNGESEMPEPVFSPHKGRMIQDRVRPPKVPRIRKRN